MKGNWHYSNRHCERQGIVESANGHYNFRRARIVGKPGRETKNSGRFDQTDDKIKALAEGRKQTTGNMKNLIAVVDRYFSEGRNGS